MRRYESVWGMNRREGFTLIEVMVAVMIISVVVAALLQLQSNNTYTFSKLQKMQKNLQFVSLLQGSKYGFENESLSLDRTVERFDLDDDLRRELKRIEAKVLYQKLDTIDTKEFDQEISQDMQEDEDSAQNDQNPMSIEIGRTVLQLPFGSASIMRIRIQ